MTVKRILIFGVCFQSELTPGTEGQLYTISQKALVIKLHIYVCHFKHLDRGGRIYEAVNSTLYRYDTWCILKVKVGKKTDELIFVINAEKQQLKVNTLNFSLYPLHTFQHCK